MNRLVDAGIDARNPRTESRELPRGTLAAWQVCVFCAGSLAVFLLAVFNLDPVVRWLWPIPVAMFVVYPYLKRVTWLSHAWLGATLGLAPVGGWVAVTGELPLAAWLLGGAVAAWVAGFDLLYAVFDIEVDRAQGLHSFPARFGVPAAFWGARVLHVATVALLAWAGARARRRRLLLARRGGGRGAARVRARDRLAGRPAPPEHGVLHAERRDQHRVLLLRAPGRRDMIRASGLAKRYGDKRVLQGVDFELPRGGFFVVTGPNGSGKTTLLRLCAGLAAPTAGELEVDAERGAIGFLGHEPLVYKELTALENLELYGRLYAIPERRERIGMLLERFGLWDVRGELVATFSRGMAQRLALCRSLLHDPELLILDEPYSALDEAGVDLLDRELAELRATATCLVATHDPLRLASLASGSLALA